MRKMEGRAELLERKEQNQEGYTIKKPLKNSNGFSLEFYF